MKLFCFIYDYYVPKQNHINTIIYSLSSLFINRNMAIVLHRIISFAVLFSLLINPCYCLNPKLFNVSESQNVNDPWQMAIATWYGAPEGAGSDGEYLHNIHVRLFNLNYIYNDLSFIYLVKE